MIRRTSKYKNIKTTVGNLKFDSKKEAKRFEELLLLLKAHEIEDLKLQHSFTLIESYTALDGEKIKAMKYIADFTYTDRKRGFVVEDVKGKRTDVYKMKKKLMKDIYDISITEV